MPTDNIQTLAPGLPRMVQATPCWYCTAGSGAACRCGRPYCGEHGQSGFCMLCALGFGIYERIHEPEPLVSLIMLRLRAAPRAPYIFVPPHLHSVLLMTMAAAENIIATLVRM